MGIAVRDYVAAWLVSAFSAEYNDDPRLATYTALDDADSLIDYLESRDFTIERNM